MKSIIIILLCGLCFTGCVLPDSGRSMQLLLKNTTESILHIKYVYSDHTAKTDIIAPKTLLIVDTKLGVRIVSFKVFDGNKFLYECDRTTYKSLPVYILMRENFSVVQGKEADEWLSKNK